MHKRIRMLGFAAIGALLFVGLSGLITLWRMSSNNRVLNEMNFISTTQYEINMKSDDSFTDPVYSKQVFNSLKNMKESANRALNLVYSPETKNDILILLQNIEHLEENYSNIIKICETRGYDKGVGLFKEYSDNINNIYQSLYSIHFKDAKEKQKFSSYAKDVYQLNKELTDYTSDLLNNRTSPVMGWKIYSQYRVFEQNISAVPDMQPVIPFVSKGRELISEMASMDKHFTIVYNNNTELFTNMLTIAGKIRDTEESLTNREQVTLIILMISLVFLLIAYLAVSTRRLRKDLASSIKVFNDLMVMKASNDAQSSFLSTVSHEIRTPINAIMGMNEIIIREANNQQIERYAREIKDSSRTLLSLVNDLLDSSRLDADKLKIIPVEYDISSTISDVTNMVRSRAKDKNLSFVVNVNDEIPLVLFGDEIRVKQCVLNLLSNAVKYTETGSITLNVDYEIVNRGSIILSFQVIDTGIGMKDEDVARLFDRFSRFDEQKNRNIEGTGLGMNIVKRLLTLMGSSLEVHSIYGKGSDFSFSIHQGVIDWNPIGDYNSKYEQSLITESKYREKLRAPGAHVLIVDDMKVNLTVFKGLLKKTQIQIDTALSGKTAIELVKKNTYNIVFLDHRMPKMDGIETLLAIKELANNPNHDIPYVALTANAITGARELYINAGFSDYLSKPIDSSALEDVLIHHLPSELVELEDIDFDADDDDSATTDENRITVQDIFEDDNYSDGEKTDEQKMHDLLNSLDGIDYEHGIENCLDDETLAEAISDFIQSIETKPDEIRGYWENKDYRNYTIQVHGLKSTARLIGADKLSADALYLEKCGDELNTAEIDAKTGALLSDYESYLTKLKPFIEFTSGGTSDEDSEESGGEPIDDAMFKEALNSVRELVDSFDFGNAEELLKMLKNYNLTSQQQSKYDIMYKMIRDVDRDAVLEWFEKEG
ncbi:MAG: response regulator [Eubacterium sp.]|nr:response regulator [Eubacterium sp.]